jgi:hypothetical protein
MICFVALAIGYTIGLRWTIKELALPAQSGKAYASSKWASKQANKDKKDKKDAWNSKKNKLEAAKQDRKKKYTKLQSQAGFSDLLKYTISFSDEFWAMFGDIYLQARELLEEFHITLPSVPSYEPIIAFISKHWENMKNAAIITELVYIIQLLVALGWLKRFDLVISGITLFANEPLRKKVTVLELMECTFKYVTLLISKIWLVIQTQDFTTLWADAIRNTYDDEYTFLKSQKVAIDLGRKAKIDDETYDRRVNECIETTLTMLNTCKDAQRSELSRRLAVLRDIQMSRVLAKKEHIRGKPYGLLLTGPTSSGKSAVINALLRFVLKINGKDHSPRAIITLNQQDKFQSEFMTHHKGVILDDICNTNEAKQEGSPVESVIMFLNQVPMAALNPNADMKGKVMIEPDVVAGTTNVKDLQSNVYSNEPLSINRRFECTITQNVKPEYCKEGTTMLDTDKITHMAGQQFPTFATFTVEEARYPVRAASDAKKTKTGKTQCVEFIPIVFHGKPLVGIEMEELLVFLAEDSKKHFAKQEAFVEGQRKLVDMPLCKCNMPASMCKECALESQAGIPNLAEVAAWYLEFEERMCAMLSDFIRNFLISKNGSIILAYFNKQFIYGVFDTIWAPFLQAFAFLLLMEFGGMRYGMLRFLFVVAAYIGFVCWKIHRARKALIDRLSNVPRPSVVWRNLEWATKKKIIGFIAALGLWKVLSYAARQWAKLPTAQAAAPITFVKNAKKYQQENEFWDVAARERQYLFGDGGVTHQAKTGTTDDMDKRIRPRLVRLNKPDGEFVQGLLLRSNVILVPNHYVPQINEYIRVDYLSGMFINDVAMSRANCVKVRGTDLAVWYAPAVGPQRDMLQYYPQDIAELKKLECYLLQNFEGKFTKSAKFTATRGRVITTGGGTFQGLNYTYPGITQGGMCMSVLVGNAKGAPFIAGHHVAGKGSVAAAAFVTRSQLLEACAELDTRPGILLSHSATPYDTEIMGVDVGPLVAPHEKCPTRAMPTGSKMRLHGQHNQPRSSPKSAVVTSIISPAVKAIMGIEKQHGKPYDLGSSDHKILDMSGKVDTATKFNPELVQKSCTDYTSQVIAGLSEQELKQVGKVSDDANLAGLDGVLGINAMNFSTSMGFPFKGPKTQVVDKSDRVVEGVSCPRDVDSSILEEVARLESILLSGKSINTTFKASLKDEPTKLTKKKARVFAAANMPMIMLTRKYFLSIAALFQRNKNLTECAVGTVVQSPEWTDLFEHIGKYGWDRAIAGDYAKFDGRMSPEFMLAAFKLLITIAERSGNYDADDLVIMRGIASEISYPTYDYFGTLVQFLGSNPSGHPLTVIINSIVNSLYMRYVYFKIAQDDGWWKTPKFADVVALMTYGDDNIMTVKKGFDAYNHTRIAQEFAKVGITYTMAEKEAESVPFIHLSGASFLKHFAVWDPEFNLYRAVIEEGSIAKMLHTHLKSKVLTDEQSSAEAITNVTLKYFEFGRKVYSEKVALLEQVAEAAGIKGYLGPIPSYDERKFDYAEKYDVVLESQSGKPKVINATDEETLQERVIELLGQPTLQEYSVIADNYGKGDLAYAEENEFYLVIETKSLVDRKPQRSKVRKQAKKYAHVLSILQPEATVVALIYSEYGFELVQVFGKRTFDVPTQWADMMGYLNYQDKLPEE